MPKFSLDNRSLTYVDPHPEMGNQTLLLIHGASSSLQVWPQAWFDGFDSRVVAIDLPGHGNSDPPGRRTVDHYASCIESSITALGLDNVVLVGHSLGSAIALTIALRSSVKLEGLILLGASARMPVNITILAGTSISMDDVATFIAEHGIMDGGIETREAVRRQVLSCGSMTTFGDFLACNRFDQRMNLPAIDTPTLIIAGDRDQMTPLRFSESLAAGLPLSQLVVLEGAGHFVMLERPDEVTRIIDTFVRKLSKRP